MIGIVARILGAVHWMRAVDLSSRKQYEAALRHVAFVEKETASASGGKPSKYSIYSGLLKAYIFYQMGRFHETIVKLTETQQKMSRASPPSEERRYLDVYMSTLYREATMNITPGEPDDIPTAFQIRHDDIDLDMVPKHVREVFPMNWPRMRDFKTLH